MNAPISTVSQCERVLWRAAGRVIGRAVDCDGRDDETVHISDEALDDFLSGDPFPE